MSNYIISFSALISFTQTGKFGRDISPIIIEIYWVSFIQWDSKWETFDCIKKVNDKAKTWKRLFFIFTQETERRE